jgi:hypothetical protein
MHRQSIVLALILAALPAVLPAQPAPGLPAFGSFSDGPFDTVNNGNLNVYFQIPIVNKAGRGLPFTYTLTYSSSVWYNVADSWGPVSNWGWTAVTTVPLTGYVSYYASLQYCINAYYTVYSDWAYHDPYGVTHAFPGNVWSAYDSQNGCGGPTTTQSLTAYDGSGYFIASIYGTGDPGPTYSGVAAANGAQINAPLVQMGVSSGSYTDRNGNILSATASGPAFTDTLGDTVLAISGSGTPASPTVLTYTNPSGEPSSYTVNYTAQTVQTAFGCSGITDYGTNGGIVQNLVSSITLPDGTSYSFTYEPTPGYPANVTGRLASVTLPTGGTISYAYSGGSNGITCADGTAATLKRYTPDSTSPGPTCTPNPAAPRPPRGVPRSRTPPATRRSWASSPTRPPAA